MTKISLEDVLILSAVRCGRFWVRLLPPSVSYAFAGFVGWCVYWMGKHRHDAYRNLRMAFASEKEPAELRRLALESIQSVALSAVDILRIPDMEPAQVDRYFTIDGRERFEPYTSAKKGIIFLTGHFGSWELLNIYSCLIGNPVIALARAQKHPRADAYLNDLRCSKGSEVIRKGMPVREILRGLKAGKVVGILSDQDGGKNGRFVEFFGRLASTPAGVAAFSLHARAPIFPSFITRVPGRPHHIDIGEPLEFPPADWPAERAETFMLQQFASALERQVRKTPGQWLWAHRRWKSSPDRRVLILSDGKAGHLNQSTAVLEAIRRERSAHEGLEQRVFSQVAEVSFRHAWLQRGVRFLSLLTGGHLPWRRFWCRVMLTSGSYRQLLHTYADIVISCGSSLVDVNLWMKQENRARSVVVMKPSFPFAHFDAVIAPKHDKMEDHPAVFATEGALSALSNEDLEVEGGVLAAELGLSSGPRRIGVLIGGNTSALSFDRTRFDELAEGLLRHATLGDSQILLTTSRRTPAWAGQALKKYFPDRNLCPLLLLANESNREGIVAGILGLSDVLVVTAESMSMLSEAVSTGKPVLVVRPWRGAGLKAKYEDYLRRLEADGRVRLCETSALGPALESAFSGAWPVTKDYRLQEEAVLHQAVRKVIG